MVVLLEPVRRQGNPRLLDKVDFGGIVGTTIRSIVLVVFLSLIGAIQAITRAAIGVINALESTITLIALAPSMTLSEVQRQAVAIAARDIVLFEAFALPAGAVVALATVAVVAFFYSVFWRP